jgi:hypothetical protein
LKCDIYKFEEEEVGEEDILQVSLGMNGDGSG